MERIDDLLRRAGGQDQTAFTAAQVLDACNRALHNVLGVDEADAHATSFRDATVFIAVSHSAIAGRVRIAHTKLLFTTNQFLGRRWPAQMRPRHLTARVN